MCRLPTTMPVLPEITGGQALRATRGTWRRLPDGRVVCPICGQVTEWPDFAKQSHLRWHLRAGWRPPAPGTLAPLPA